MAGSPGCVLAGSFAGFPVWGLVAGAVKDKYGRAVGKKVIPALSESIRKGDEAITPFLQKVSPERSQRLLETTGRITGVETGVEAERQQRLIPPQRTTGILPVQQ